MAWQRAGTEQPNPLLEEPITKIEEYIHDLKLNGRAAETQSSRLIKLKQLSKTCNINNPYEVKELLAAKKMEKLH